MKPLRQNQLLATIQSKSINSVFRILKRNEIGSASILIVQLRKVQIELLKKKKRKLKVYRNKIANLKAEKAESLKFLNNLNKTDCENRIGIWRSIASIEQLICLFKARIHQLTTYKRDRISYIENSSSSNFHGSD